MSIMYGMGRLTFTETNSADGLYLPIEPMSFALENASNNIKSSKYVDGLVVTAGSGINSSEWTMTLGIEAVNWTAIQFALGEIAGTTAAIDLPELRYGAVPASGTLEWADADIDALTVRVGILDEFAGGPLKTVAIAPANAKEVQVDDAAGKLVFHASHAGKQFAYRIFKAHTNLSSIGAEAAYQAISKFSFEGILSSDGPPIKLVIPSIQRASFPNISLSDVTRFDLTFDLLNVGNSRLPFKLYKLA